MKLIKKLLLIGLPFFLNSCSDFMEPNSLSTFDGNYIFSNVDDARKSTNAIYRGFGQDGYRTRLSITFQLASDIDQRGTLGSAKANDQVIGMYADASNADINQVWTTAYGAIKDCNFVIDGIKASAIYNSTDAATSAKMHQYIGEAYAIRAFWYSQLVYNFGDVPFMTQSPLTTAEFNLPKTDRNVILSAVIQDLIYFEATMGWADALPFGIQQVNREYVMGMIARISLQRGGYYLKPDLSTAVATPADRVKYYTLAKEYCTKLTQMKPRALPTDFAQVFKNQCQKIYPKNEDMLFEVPFAVGTGEVGYNVGMRINAGTPASLPYGTGAHDMSIPLSYFYSFDTKDKRRDATCGMYNLMNTGVQNHVAFNDIAQRKWSKEYCNPPLGNANTKGTTINWPMMRYSDVLLMLAESENELNGPTIIAQNALKLVRKRAFDSTDWPAKVDAYLATASASKDAFFNAIVDERAWEFGGELLRKQELIRWNLQKTIMTKASNQLKALADESQIPNNLTSVHPNYLYYRLDGGKMTVYKGYDTNDNLPPNYTVPTNTTLDATTLPLVNGWFKISWISGLKSSSTVDGYNDLINSTYSPYYGNYVRYIQPIPATAINNSFGVLANDGYGF